MVNKLMVTREVLIIGMDPDGGMWSAGAMVKKQRGTCVMWAVQDVWAHGADGRRAREGD